jgi:hypothetical protein
MKGLATKVLLITSDDELIDSLAGNGDEKITLRFARNAYEASAIISSFRPAFAAIDAERITAAETGLMDSLAADPRLPGLRIILVVGPGMAGRTRRWPKSDLVVSVLEKPLDTQRIAAVTTGFLVESITLEECNPQVTTEKESQ